MPAGTETSAPAGDEPVVTGSGTIGPTTSGPECQFTENDELPLERCDAGPAIAALQSVLQTLNYGIGTVDCLLRRSDAVRRGGVPGTTATSPPTASSTKRRGRRWRQSFLAGWGEDANGNGVIEPNEITLECGV